VVDERDADFELRTKLEQPVTDAVAHLGDARVVATVAQQDKRRSGHHGLLMKRRRRRRQLSVIRGGVRPGPQ
jgi:hypothetical protein